VSNLERAPEIVEIPDSRPGIVHAVDVLEARKAAIGDGTEVRRLLPQKTLRTVGAWCFLDHYGPDDVSRGLGMQVPPHPHIGLQTASWLFEGHVLHRDSLGSQQLIRPGELNLMTSGRGIAHSEESPRGRPARLHGLQLWIALPDEHRYTEPSFAHHAVLPVLEEPTATITVIVGEYQGEQSPAQVHTPLAGYEVAVYDGAGFTLQARPEFEYAVLAVDGAATVTGTGSVTGANIEPGLLAHLPAGMDAIGLAPAEGTRDPARFFILGGEPFEERLLMWWNFVARTPEEITSARDDWTDGVFAPVRGTSAEPLAAPSLPAGRLRPR
jgi:hypothetical protein